MTTTAVSLLAVIAAATAIMAIAQLLLMLVMQRTALTLVKSVQEFQRDVQPILDQARHAAADAARVASIAARQAERMDVMLTTVTARVDETLSAVHRIVAGPVTQSAAVWAGLRAVLAMLADRRRGEGDTPEDEDALFVG